MGDTSDSEAFESADENFDNDTENQSIDQNQSDSGDSDSNIVSATVVSSNKVHKEIDDISNLLDNLQVKFEHCRTVETDDFSETNKTSVWDEEDVQNLNTASKTCDVKSSDLLSKERTSKIFSSIETTKIQSDLKTSEWDDLENLNIESSGTIISKFVASKDVESSGWDDEDIENLNIDSSEKITTNPKILTVSEDVKSFNKEIISDNFTKFTASEDIEPSGWDDEDVENLNIESSKEIATSLLKFASPENVESFDQKKIDTRVAKFAAADDIESSGWDDEELENLNIESEKIMTAANSTKFSVPQNIKSSAWDEKDLEKKEKITTVENPSKFAAIEDDIDTSGWDNDVDWEPIENDDKVEKASTGWDDFDTWDTIEDVKTTQQQPQQPQQQSSGGWSSWGVTSLLSSATEGVTTFTSQVSQGLTTVLESSIGVPSPEELAKAQKLERAKLQETPQQEVPQSNEMSSSGGGSGVGGVFGLGNLLTGVTHITKLVETTSSKVVNTGLDTLETIGKKTMEVLQEGDPGLIKKRALLGLNPDKPCLSQVLREAKEKASVEDDAAYAGDGADKRVVVKKVHFETLFDDYQGLVHLEALEMLSKQCDIKLCTIIESMQDGSKELEDIQETMVQIKELCELPDDEDDDNNEQLQQLDELKIKLSDVVDELGLQTPITFTKLFECWNDAEQSMKSITDVHEIHRMGIDTLAKITSLAVEQFHKCAELLLIKERRSTADEADSLVQITTILTALIGAFAAKYSEKLDSLSSLADNPDLNSLITNIFFEATQSSSYVQDAFQLFIPILQIGAV